MIAGRLIGAAVTATLLGTSAAQPAPVKIHNGMTGPEFAAFAARQGWTVRGAIARTAKTRALTVVVKKYALRVTLYDCNRAGRCPRAMLQLNAPFRFAGTDATTSRRFTKWNKANRGATLYNIGGYEMARRFIHLRGVTDQYLREVIGEDWVRAVSRL